MVYGWKRTDGVWMDKDWWCVDGQRLVLHGWTMTDGVWMDND